MIEKKFVIIVCHLFSTAQILQRHVNDYFQINVKQMIQIVKKDETFKLKRNKSIQEKILKFIIYVDFESILVPENDGKQNPDKSDTNKYQNTVGFSFTYKLACVDDQFSKHLCNI